MSLNGETHVQQIYVKQQIVSKLFINLIPFFASSSIEYLFVNIQCSCFCFQL